MGAIIEASLGLVSRQLSAARSAGVAPLSHLIYYDYNTTHDIVMTCRYLSERLLDSIEKSPEYKVGLYEKLIERLRLFLKSLHIDNLTTILNKMLDSMKSVYDAGNTLRGTNKSPDMRAHVLYDIASRFVVYPVVRRNWLQKIVRGSNEAGLYAPAFVAELHTAALIARVLSQLGEITAFDFSFVPSTEDEMRVDVSKVDKSIAPIMTYGFDIDSLVKSLTMAVQYGRMAGMNWQTRSVYLLLLAVQEVRQEFNEIVGIVGGLADEYEKIEKSCGTSPLHFYLVDHRRSGKSIDSRVYSSAIPAVDDFVDFLNDRSAQRHAFCEPAVAYDSLNDASHVASGIIATPLESTIDYAFLDNTRDFVQYEIRDSDEWESVARRRTLVFTKQALPNCSAWATVDNIQTSTYTGIESLKLIIDETVGRLQDLRQSLFVNLPMKSTLEVWKRSKPCLNVSPLAMALKEALNGAAKQLCRASQSPGPHSDEITQMSRLFASEIGKCLRVMGTCVNELREKQIESDAALKALCDCASKIAIETVQPALSFSPVMLRNDIVLYHRDFEEY